MFEHSQKLRTLMEDYDKVSMLADKAGDLINESIVILESPFHDLDSALRRLKLALELLNKIG